MSAAHDNGPSESSSGYEDGLGRRVLIFDRETGAMRERLRLRPELRVFTKQLNERLPLVAGLEDERFARPLSVEPEPDGRLAVVSDFVGGRRLSDILDAAADQAIVAGLDAGLGVLLELLPALSRLHDAGITHGALGAGRIMVTPAGQLVVLDAIYSEVLEKLQLTRKRLWAELRLAFPSTAGAPRFDKAADLTQAAIVAASLIVGRPLRDDEYPDGLAALRHEIIEIASIRASKTFAEGLDKFFAAALPLATRKTALTSADEAAIDLRKLLRKEVGITTCRNAMLEFFQQVDTAEKERAASVEAETAKLEAERVAAVEARAREDAERKAREDAERKAREEAERKAREEADRKAREEADRKAREEADRKAREEADRKAREEADRKAREEADRKAREEADRKAREEAERKAREEAERKAREEAERKAREEAERKAREEAERKAREEAERKAREEAERKTREEAERKAREEAERKAREEAERKAREEAERKAREEAERRAREEAERKAREEAERKAREEAERKSREEAERKAREEAERKAREEAERKAREEAERKAREEAERRERERLEAERKAREEAERKAREEAERRERERLEAERKAREEAERKAREEAERKAREEAERIEKARIEAERRERQRIEAERRERERAEQEARERIEKARIEAERAERERIERERAEAERRAREDAERKAREEQAAREREAAAAAAPPPQTGGWLVPPDRASSFEPPVDEPPPPPPPAPSQAARAYPIYVPPAETESWTPAPEQAAPAIEIAPVAAAAPPPAPIKVQTAAAATGIRLKDEPAQAAGPARAESRHEPDEMSAEGAYEPFGSRKEQQPIPWKLLAAGVVLIAVTFALTKGFLPSEIPVPTLGKKAAALVKKAPPPAAAPTGGTHLAVTTEPGGVRVLVDGKFVGTSPVTLDTITPGRHVVTLQAASGSIKRTVRVELGKTTTLDVPVYSGFAVISAPFIVDVAEGGKVLGSSEDQIILGPGHHELHLQNNDLNYTETRGIDIEPGETTRLAIDPRGSANINAVPWAEVFIDGEKAGETPLANVAVRLGVREIVFRNPQFPERKIVTTIKAGTPVTLTVDFAKDK